MVDGENGHVLLWAKSRNRFWLVFLARNDHLSEMVAYHNKEKDDGMDYALIGHTEEDLPDEGDSDIKNSEFGVVSVSEAKSVDNSAKESKEKKIPNSFKANFEGYSMTTS
ncbi:hypothetical protein OUZ56_005769 [Daphnia magna]|uniref:Uncharacterized protein n=1 Tax=Daphnia magna TaxID=35525 RepID=A0ABQ9YTQ4_9CRUS|nr:hypothetical protein OUZ56_005769 [Daphnia magna]